MNIYHLSREWAHKKGIALYDEQTLPSTNDWAKAQAFQTPSDTALYLTEHQTQGRGRYERTWCEQGEGKFFLGTWSFRVPFPPSPVVTARIGLNVVKAFHKSFPALSWSLKAPNDVFLTGQKVCGILTETVSQGDKHRLLIGLGINVLGAPEKVKEAIALNAWLPAFNEGDWLRLLDQLKENLEELVPLAHMNELQSEERSQILHWLNQNPNLKYQYSSVDQDGSLLYEDRKIDWSEL
jgi:biotin-[acetyl-CoA-carboxylase] ligase BirA-like protein